MDSEQRISALENRNRIVDAHKRWETSWFRRLCIATIAYIVAYAWMTSIGVEVAFLSACIPTGGYLLSTLSLTYARRVWSRYVDAVK